MPRDGPATMKIVRNQNTPSASAALTSPDLAGV